MRSVVLALAWNFNDICRPGDAKEGGCSVDGKDCDGEQVRWDPYPLNVTSWDPVKGTSTLRTSVPSYAIFGQQHTWEMYLHGPKFHASERASPLHIPNVWVFATFTNQIYRFENFSLPAAGGKEPLTATQKLVGHALAPSTGYIVENDRGVQGLMVAEGEPFLFSSAPLPHEVYFGGVQFMHTGHKKNCTQFFPTGMRRMMGQVVNTVDCHPGTETCFFSVWNFYDDQQPIWNNISKLMANDCLYYCIMEPGSLTDEPTCKDAKVLHYETGEPICHKDGVGSVHGFTVGNTDSANPNQFDLLLVFTGKALMSNGESSMKKVTVRVVDDLSGKDLLTVKSMPYAQDLFTRYSGDKTLDVGGDHAWVDETRKFVWISCFRVGGLGVHMVDYETGALKYSITGLDSYARDQYTYTAGVHGIGTVGKPGSYLALATSSCHNISVCIPIIPWSKPVPEKMWSTAPFIIVDIGSLDLEEALDEESVLV